MPKAVPTPGAPEGTEIVALVTPFGGWATTPSGATLPGTITGANGHYQASIEGVSGGLSKPESNQYAESDGVTLFTPEKFGHLAPVPLWTLVGYTTDLPLNGGLSTSTGTIPLLFVVLQNGQVFCYVLPGTLRFSYAPAIATGVHEGQSFPSAGSTNADGDIIVMYDQTGEEWAIWSWEVTGSGGDSPGPNGDISIARPSSANGWGSTPIDAWYSGIFAVGAANSNDPASADYNGTLTAGVPHKILKGGDQNLYVSNGNIIQQIFLPAGVALSSLNAAYYAANVDTLPPNNQLNLGADFVITSMVDYTSGYRAILASKKGGMSGNGVSRGETWLYLWAGTATLNAQGVTEIAPQFAYPVPDNYGDTLFFDGQTLWVVSNGRSGSSKIWEFTGKGFKLPFENALLPTTGIVGSGGVESYQQSMMIGGLKAKGSFPSATNVVAKIFRYYNGGFHDEGNVTPDGVSLAYGIGMLKNFYLNYLYAGVQIFEGGEEHYGIYYQDPSGAQGYQLNSAIRTILNTQGILGRRVYPLGFKGTMNRIQLYLSQWGAGAAIYISLFKDYTFADIGNALGTGNDLLNILIDTNTNIPNGWQTGTNYFGGTGYMHYAYPVGTTEIDRSDVSVVDLSSFYVVVTWTHLTTSAVAAILRRLIFYWAPSQ